MQFYMPPNSTPQERADGEARYRANINRIWQAADGSWMSNTGGGIGRFQTEADAIEDRRRYTSGGYGPDGAFRSAPGLNFSGPMTPTVAPPPVQNADSLLNLLAGGSANRQSDLSAEANFNALVNANNVQASLIGAPSQELPQSMDQIRLNQIASAVPSTQFGFLQQPVVSPQTGGPFWTNEPGVNPNKSLPGQPQPPVATSLFDTWQQYATNAGWASPQVAAPAQPAMQPVAQYQAAPQQQSMQAAPAQMSLGQMQPQAGSQSVSAGTSASAYPGQRYQPQSLGGFNWQQPQQQQGQQQAAQLQTGQQGFGMGGQFRQRRQQGLGMLGQALIA